MTEGNQPEMGEAERDAVEIYQALKRMLKRSDLAPGVRANASQALACMWQVVNNLGLDDELLYDLGV